MILGLSSADYGMTVDNGPRFLGSDLPLRTALAVDRLSQWYGLAPFSILDSEVWGTLFFFQHLLFTATTTTAAATTTTAAAREMPTMVMVLFETGVSLRRNSGGVDSVVSGAEGKCKTNVLKSLAQSWKALLTCTGSQEDCFFKKKCKRGGGGGDYMCVVGVDGVGRLLTPKLSVTSMLVSAVA